MSKAASTRARVALAGALLWAPLALGTGRVGGGTPAQPDAVHFPRSSWTRLQRFDRQPAKREKGLHRNR